MQLTSNAPQGDKPLYIKVKEDILHYCSNLNYYSPLPGERELCELFGASRPTVRKALNLLENDGKILTISGKGNFFIGNKVHTDHQLNSPMGFYKDVRLQGKITKSKVLSQNIEKASKEIAECFGIEEGERVFHLERLRYIDDKLYSLTNSYLPMEIGIHLLKVDFTTSSLYDVLSQNGIIVYKGHQVLEVKPAHFYDALHLEMQEGDPISIISSTTSQENGSIVEFVTIKTKAYTTKYEMDVYANGEMYH